MSGVVSTFNNLARDVAGAFGLKHSYDKATKSFGIDITRHGDALSIPGAPTIGQAQLGASQEDDFLRRRRGVLANIYGGGSGASAPAPASGSNTLLGQ